MPGPRRRDRLVAALKHRLLAPLLYRHPPVGLQPERLYAWLRALEATRDLDGAIVEVGCSVGGTAAVAARFVSRTGPPRPYLCIDTFSGFPQGQFEDDLARGNRPANRHLFAQNRPALVRWVLDHHGAPEVALLQADIATLDPDRLPARISAALVDVDLALPVQAALERLWPRLLPGGWILVDDCPPTCDWRAREGYRSFVRGRGLPERYLHDMGLVVGPGAEGTTAPVPC
jgi:O-methyltransferase